jgi:CubicO group peptidase (beta-lactamase class C family)
MITLLATLSLASATLQAPDPLGLEETVRGAVKEFMSNGQTVGMSIAIVKGNEVLTYNFGSKLKERPLPATSSTRYFIGSITKTFAGQLLAQAAVEKKLNLSDDVRKYLPGRYPNLQFEGTPIQVWHLVDHVSGLPFALPEKPAPWTLPSYDVVRSSKEEAEQIRHYGPREFYRDLHGVKLIVAPGTKFSYSNAGAQLAGLILERIYRKSFEQLVSEKITRPLGMADTKIVLSRAEQAELPRGYSSAVSFLPALPSNLPAAGSIKSTAADMAKYLKWHLTESDPAVKVSHKPVLPLTPNFAVGLNWQILTSNGLRVIFQDGNVPGFHSLCVLYPELEMGIVILTNGEAGLRPTPLSPLVDQIMRRINPRAPSVP